MKFDDTYPKSLESLDKNKEKNRKLEKIKIGCVPLNRIQGYLEKKELMGQSSKSFLSIQPIPFTINSGIKEILGK